MLHCYTVLHVTASWKRLREACSWKRLRDACGVEIPGELQVLRAASCQHLVNILATSRALLLRRPPSRLDSAPAAKGAPRAASACAEQEGRAVTPQQSHLSSHISAVTPQQRAQREGRWQWPHEKEHAFAANEQQEQSKNSDQPTLFSGERQTEWLGGGSCLLSSAESCPLVSSASAFPSSSRTSSAPSACAHDISRLFQ